MFLRKFFGTVFSDSTVPEPLWEGGLELVPVIDVERIYVESDIKEAQTALDDLRDAETHLVDRINDYGKALDSALKDELDEYKRLENELAAKQGKDKPFEDSPDKEEQIKEAIKNAKEREENNEHISSDGCDPKVHKLYKMYAKIYHPDKASEEDKEYFNEVFQMLNHYKMLNDYRGLKEFCKKLRKKTRAEVVTHIEDLKTLLNQLREEISVAQAKCKKLLDDPLQERADEYYADPEVHILRARTNLQSKIELLRAKLDGSPPSSYGGGLWD